METILAVIGCFAVIYASLALGGYLIAWDAEQRLTGKKPIDDFWRKRGMK